MGRTRITRRLSPVAVGERGGPAACTLPSVPGRRRREARHECGVTTVQFILNSSLWPQAWLLPLVLISARLTFKRRKTPGATALIVMMLLEAWSLLFQLLEPLADSPDLKRQLRLAGLLAVAFWSPTWLQFTFSYVGSARSVFRGRLRWVWVVPALTVVILTVPGLQRFMLERAVVDELGRAVVLTGRWFQVHTLNTYGGLAIAGWLLLRHATNNSGIYREQAVVLLVTETLPLIYNLVVMVLYGGRVVNQTVAVVAASSMLIMVAIFRLRLFDLAPLARATVVDRMKEAVFVLDDQRRLVDTNQAARELLGALGTGELGSSLPLELASVPLREACEGITLPNARDYERTVVHLHEARGHRSGWLVQLRDVTEAKEAQRQLEQAKVVAEAASRARSEFLALMSHELRTPMNGIIGTASLLQVTPLDAEQRELVETIDTSGQSLLVLLNDILDLSKIEAGKLKIENAPFSVTRTATQVVRLFEPAAAKKGLSLSLDAQLPADAWALGDELRFRQILTNQLSNALKFTERGSIRVTVRRDGELVRVAVADTGIGVSPEALLSIFEAFAQADSSTARRFGGTGLGLTICRRLCQQMEGDIHVKSELGVGSTFEYWLKLPEAAALAPDARVELAPANARSLRVLVADDNAINRRVARAMLLRLGHSCEVAEDGQQAVEAVARERFDVVLMDLHMPQLDGLEAARRIRGLDGLQPPAIFALTAAAFQEDAAKCLAAGMTGVLTKPIRLQVLQEALAGCADGREQGLRAVASS